MAQQDLKFSLGALPESFNLTLDKDDDDDPQETSSTIAPSSTTGKVDSDDSAVVMELVKRETKLVRVSKALVFAALTVAAAVCGACTYLIIRRFEDAGYREEVRT